MLLFFSYNLVGSFLINISQNVGGDTKLMGYMYGYMSLLELPLMISYTSIRKRFSCESIMIISSTFFCIKNFGIAIAQSSTGVFLALTAHAFSYGLIIPCMVDYINTNIPYCDSGKGQSLAMGMITLGSLIASASGGWMYDAMPINSIMVVGGIVALIGTAIIMISIKNKSMSKMKKQFRINKIGD